MNIQIYKFSSSTFENFKLFKSTKQKKQKSLRFKYSSLYLKIDFFKLKKKKFITY